MGDFVAFSEDIDAGMEFLEHHQILGAKWGVMNGPPYPLGRGDHSSAEKNAAKAAGVTVGKSSGKGSIDNVKKKNSSRSKSLKKEMTPEEKRQAALEAAKTGDKKNITKYMDQLSTEELRDAQARSQMRDSLSRKDPNEQKASKAEMEKQEAIKSGDKEKVKQYADQMTYQELAEAMNKVELTQKLNKVDPPKTALDKLTDVASKVDQFRQAAEKGVGMYNLAAKVYNSTHKDGPQWPIIENQNNNKKESSKEQEIASQLAKQAMNDVANGIKQSQQQKSYKEKSDEELKNKKIDYENQKKYDEWVAKQEKGKKTQEELNQKLDEKAKAENKDHEYVKKIGEGEDAQYIYKEDLQAEKQRKYTPERAPKLKEKNTEPTEEQKRLVDEARKSDDAYLAQIRDISNQRITNNSSWEDTWRSVDQVQSNRPISDDLTPAEERYLNSFR